MPNYPLNLNILRVPLGWDAESLFLNPIVLYQSNVHMECVM